MQTYSLAPATLVLLDEQVVARLDILVHHGDATTVPKSSKVVIANDCALAARPAELILAENARHMVASFVLLDPGATHRTERDIVFVLVDPHLQVLIHGVGTGYLSAVPLFSTLKTDFCLTLGALQLDYVLVLSSHVFLTA